MSEIDELTEIICNANDNNSPRAVAIKAFKYFHDMAKKQVIDEDILSAILKDAGED